MAQAKILFYETAGCGSDEESNTPDGVAVCLTGWEAESNDWRLTDHFVLETVTVVDHAVAAHTIRMIRGRGYMDTAEAIRTAIKEFDSLMQAHPNFGPVPA